jgi:hypothetical protein
MAVIVRLDRTIQYAAASGFILNVSGMLAPAFAEDDSLRADQFGRFNAATGPPARGLSLRASICFR